jgi:hypothetical protein
MLRVRRWVVAASGFAGTVWLAASPEVAGAQTIRGVLRQLEKATRPVDSTAGRGERNTEGTSSGGAIRVLSTTVEGEDTVSARFSADTGTRRTKATEACGPRRACVPGWDLRVLQVTVPGPLVPRGQPLHLTTVVENRGLAAAPATEVALCYSRGQTCDARIDILPIPSLASGERLTFARYVKTGGQDRDGVVRVEIDLDRVTEASNRDNDAAVSAPFRTTSPELQWVALEVPPTLASGQAVPVRLRVRNKSTVAVSQSVEVQVAYASGYCTYIGLEGSQYRFVLPTLGPRQTAVVTLRFVEPINPGCVGDGKLFVKVDPDGRQVWGPSHEPTGERGFKVVAGAGGGRD